MKGRIVARNSKACSTRRYLGMQCGRRHGSYAILITAMLASVDALRPSFHSLSRHQLVRCWVRDENRGGEGTQDSWSRSDFVKASIGATAALLVSPEETVAYVDFDKDWAGMEVPNKKAKPFRGKAPSSFRQPSATDNIAKQLSNSADAAARTAKQQGKALTRDVKAAAYDAETIGRSTEREFKKAAGDPGSYVKKNADNANRAAQKEVKIATRDAQKLVKEVKKDPGLYAQKSAEKASLAAQEKAKEFEKELRRAF
mmetsp:Transcript_35476/g.70390  ORF Transcript_35476/g.70390 Transcript_35476/m.70390 type:complete len:257 (-) Transcript_35476:92-862(-)